MLPGNNEQQTDQEPQTEPKKGPAQKPAPAPASDDSTSLVAYAVASLDAIAQNKGSAEEFAGLLNSVVEIAQKLKEGQSPTNNAVKAFDVVQRISAINLAQSLKEDLTVNWETEKKVASLGFNSNSQIQKLAYLTQSARELLGQLLIAIVQGKSTENLVALRSATTGTVDADLDQIANLAYTMNDTATIDQLLILAVNQLEILAQKATKLQSITLTQNTKASQLFKQFPAIINPLIEIGQGILEETPGTSKFLYANKTGQHKINMAEIENQIRAQQGQEGLAQLQKLAEELTAIIGENNRKEEEAREQERVATEQEKLAREQQKFEREQERLAYILQQEKIAQNKADAQNMATGIILTGLVLKALQLSHSSQVAILKAGNQIKYMVGDTVMAVLPTSTINNLVLPKPLPSISRIVPPTGYATPTAPLRPIPGVTGGNAQIQRGLQTMLGFIKRAKGRF